MGRPLYYSWDVSNRGTPLGQMTPEQLEAHLAALRARQVELEAVDLRLRRNARQLGRDRDVELARLRLAITDTEHELESKRTRGF